MLMHKNSKIHIPIEKLIESPFKSAVIITILYAILGVVWLTLGDGLIGYTIEPETGQLIPNHHYYVFFVGFIFFTSILVFTGSFILFSKIRQLYRFQQNVVSEQIDIFDAAEDEMMEFTRKMSHDLRAPLRSVQGFSQAIGDDYGDSLDSTALDYLTRIRRSAERMDNILIELVGYARLRKHLVRKVAIDPENAIKTLEKEVGAQTGITSFKVNFDGFITPIYADSTLLHHILFEILSNAATYVGAGNQPEVTIRSNKTSTSTQLSFSDNGIGIDQKFYKDIFKIFTRLHGVEEYPGIGLGLATASRCAKMMGGSIWVSSTNNAQGGSTFTLELPLPEEKHFS
jgi:signal transduction histidine kinase